MCEASVAELGPCVFCHSHKAEEACSLHDLLPRTLEFLSRESSDSQDSGLDPAFEALLRSSDLSQDDPGDDVAGNDLKTWEAMLLEIMDAREMSHAEVIRKRKRLTFQAFKDVSTVPRIIALEALVAPNVRSMYTLFQRSAAVASLHKLPASDAEACEERRQKHLGWICWAPT